MQAGRGDAFDYVIVGAGSAGCVLANRLSEDANVRVCLIEAGGRDWHPLIRIPLAVPLLMHNKRMNWGYWTSGQEHAGGRAIYVPRGKVIGGSSSINGMVYMRGHRADYDDWAAAGNAGWSFREVLPYFKKSENNQTFGETPYHGVGGPMNVTNVDSYSPLVEMMCRAAEELQFKRSADFNGPQQEGFGKRQSTQRNGVRESTATAFHNPARKRRNLTIVSKALVDRVTFSGKRATGVEVVEQGWRRNIAARHEVILAAGTIASPMILMRSGVGPGLELARHGIAVTHDLPGVGRNLQDHLTVPVQHSSPTTIPYGVSWRTVPLWAWNIAKYALTRRGLLANSLLHAGGFIRSEPSLDRPDLQFILMPLNRTPNSPTGLGHGYGLLTVLLRPKSRGEIRLTTIDPEAPPHIDPRFLSETADVELLLRGVKLSRRMLESHAWDAVRGPEIRPGPNVASDDALRGYIRESAATVFHPVGTCKMGNGEDAVVDPQLRVRGVDGLRVADASIMPTLIGGNTNAPVIMIAEKAADMIRGRPPMPAANV
jgi:choline dehydrogenase-like flavoprotein